MSHSVCARRQQHSLVLHKKGVDLSLFIGDAGVLLGFFLVESTDLGMTVKPTLFQAILAVVSDGSMTGKVGLTFS